MNWLDIVILTIVALLTFVGWRNGVLRVVVLLGGAVLGVYLAGQYYQTLGTQLESIISSPNGAKAAAFVIVFLIVLSIASVIVKALRGLLRVALLSWLDNGIGAILGAVVGLAISTGIAMGLQAFPIFDLAQAVQASFLGSFLVNNFPVILSLLPKEFDSVKDLAP